MPSLIKKYKRLYYQSSKHQLKLILFFIVIFPLTFMSSLCAEEGNTNQILSDAPVTAENESELPVEEDSGEVAKALEDLLEAMQLGNFEYKVEERPDPFTPFISDRILNTEGTDSETGERLTGMRQFEPGQLNLVAIIFTEANPMAMVEDSSHRGYLVRRGTKIGKTGIVTDILPNEVIIKQLSYSMDQATKYSTIEMILRKEGEK